MRACTIYLLIGKVTTTVIHRVSKSVPSNVGYNLYAVGVQLRVTPANYRPYGVRVGGS